jgi:Fe2+ transport system protein FeoA
MLKKFFMKRLRKRVKIAHKLRLLDRHHKYPHIHKYYNQDKPLISLSVAKKGEYEFITTLCEHEMEHRLLEMGFIPKTIIKVIENSDSSGAIFIEIKGSKLALNRKIANDILVVDTKN